MRGLQATISRLTKLRSAANDGGHGEGRLGEITSFGADPGNLRALTYVPDSFREGGALVVVLHGCTQHAGGYDRGSGWSELADRHGFALLYPEQRRANNPNLCFNWYAPADARRGKGEARSIAEMVKATVEAEGIDRARVFVTGLSAGGAMTAVMLATYPELFAGGAIIAGLPFATADTLPDALERMRGSGGPGEARLVALAAGAAPQVARPPTLSVWHGSGDHVVAPWNGERIVAQWRGLHGVERQPTRTDTIDGHRRRTWADADGRAVIEHYEVAGLGHGVPLVTRGADGVGQAGPHMFEAGICSTRHIAHFWGLLGDNRVAVVPVDTARTARPDPVPPPVSGVTAVIEDALRKAGLMR